MSLSDWAANGWVIEQEFSASEIRDMLAAADRDMAQCQVVDLDPDWRLNIAYNASPRLAAAALAASGYRAAREANHYRLICSLEHTIGSQAKFIRHLDTFRKNATWQPTNMQEPLRPGTQRRRWTRFGNCARKSWHGSAGSIPGCFSPVETGNSIASEYCISSSRPGCLQWVSGSGRGGVLVKKGVRNGKRFPPRP